MCTVRSSSRHLLGGGFSTPPRTRPLPRNRHPPWAQTPQSRYPPWDQIPPQDQPPGAGIPPGSDPPPRSRPPCEKNHRHVKKHNLRNFVVDGKNRPDIQFCHEFAFLPFIDLSDIWPHDLTCWCPSAVKCDGLKWNINNNWEERSLVSVACINLIFAEKSLFISGSSNPSISHDKRQTVVWKCFILMTRGAVVKNRIIWTPNFSFCCSLVSIRISLHSVNGHWCQGFIAKSMVACDRLDTGQIWWTGIDWDLTFCAEINSMFLPHSIKFLECWSPKIFLEMTHFDRIRWNRWNHWFPTATSNLIIK